VPVRLGIALRPKFHSIVLIGQKARITRPNGKVDGLDSVIKSDQLRTLIEQRIDGESVGSSLMTAGKLVSSDTLEEFAKQVARLHRPLRRDWSQTFDLSEVPTVEALSSLGRTSHDSRVARAHELPVQRPAASSGDAKDRLTTSKLGAVMGLPNVEATLARLTSMGYLEIIDGQHRLTDKGREAGGQHVPKGRFGPYFLWPSNFSC
jgi:hypothetical protein